MSSSNSSKPVPSTSTPSARASANKSPSTSSCLGSRSKVILLYCKSKVCLHPTNLPKDNIPGYVILTRSRGGSNKDVILSWVPEDSLETGDVVVFDKVDMLSVSELDPVDTGYGNKTTPQEFLIKKPLVSSLSSYAFSIPIADIYSLQIRVPTVGLWCGSIVIHPRTSEVLPVLFFHDEESPSTLAERKIRNQKFEIFSTNSPTSLFWGGDQLMDEMSKYVVVVKSSFEPSIFLINPDSEDRRSFSPLVKKINNESTKKPMDLKSFLKEAKWTVLERIAQITHNSKKAAIEVIDNNAPPQLRALLNQPEVKRIGEEFDSARVYLAKWALSAQEEAERSRYKRIQWNTEYDIEILSLEDEAISRRNEVGKVEWESFFDYSGRLQITAVEVKERIFHGGIADNIRHEVWPFLLGVYPWNSSDEERRIIRTTLRSDYEALKKRWYSDEDLQKYDEFWKDQKFRIEKDIFRTDRNHPMFKNLDIPNLDPDTKVNEPNTNVHLEQLKVILITFNEYNVNLGYVQGMSDLLSPIYVVMQDDGMAFWGFARFMERMERNFLRDQSGMREQLKTLELLVQFMNPDLHKHLEKCDSTNFFFFFRMLLVWFKREFDWEHVLKLWEVLWTDYYSSQFHLFFALAILDKHQFVIMEHLERFDEVLKYINDLSMDMNLDDILVRAEKLFLKFKKMCDVVDKKASYAPVIIGSTGSVEDQEEVEKMSEELKLLLSKDIIVTKESERPSGAGGG